LSRARSPLRVSFAGGGTDIPEYASQYGGCCVNAAIAKYAYASTSPTFGVWNISGPSDTKLMEAVANRLVSKQAVIAHVQAPPLSGLGGSAAVAVATAGALQADISKEKAWRVAYLAERVDMSVPGGMQDQIVSAYGGINQMIFGSDLERIPLSVLPKTVLDLEKHLILCFIQARKLSGPDVLADQIARLKSGETIAVYHRLKEVAFEMVKSLLNGDTDNFGNLLTEDWKAKRLASPLISNPFIDGVLEFALKAGARGGKLLGAGGGGYLLLYSYPDRELELMGYLRQIGLNPEQVHFDWEGLQTW
jgi:D-glycero-alpha-D-manno-heptose-7-phosphate kinase